MMAFQGCNMSKYTFSRLITCKKYAKQEKFQALHIAVQLTASCYEVLMSFVSFMLLKIGKMTRKEVVLLRPVEKSFIRSSHLFGFGHRRGKASLTGHDKGYERAVIS